MKKIDGKIYLDRADKEILRALTDNAKTTLTAIGEKAGISRVAVHRRIFNMEYAGIIEGYTVIVDWSKVENS
jgi:Lrp/AsnC family leucine-responsive transcriptional regulator